MRRPEADRPVPSFALRGVADIEARSAFKMLMDPENGWPRECLTQDVVQVMDRGKPLVFLSNPEMIKAVLGNPAVFTRDPAYQKIFGRGLGRQSLTVAEGDLWREMRAALAPLFRPATLPVLVGSVSRQARRRIAFWAGTTRRDFKRDARALSLAMIWQTVFGAQDRDPPHALLDEAAGTLTEAFCERDLAKAIGQIDRLAKTGLETASDDPLLPQNPFQRGGASGLSDDALYSSARLLMDAGHETTAATLMWAVWLLGRDPARQSALRAEVRRVVGDGPVTLEALEACNGLEATLHEVMRLFPAAPVLLRRAAAPWSDGFDVPDKARVALCLYAMQRRPDFWVDAGAFRPERWGHSVPPSAFLPFGSGMNRCVGMALGMMQLKVVLAELLRAMTWQAGQADLGPAMLVTLQPAEPLSVCFSEVSR